MLSKVPANPQNEFIQNILLNNSFDINKYMLISIICLSCCKKLTNYLALISILNRYINHVLVKPPQTNIAASSSAGQRD